MTSHPIRSSPGDSGSLSASLQELVEIVARLRSPQGGCPWDLQQTPESLIPFILEEAYEVIEAIRGGQIPNMVDELGDLLLQVVLQAQIASEQQHFTLEEVIRAIAQKLIRRHPHVFGQVTVGSVAEVNRNWEMIKREEQAASSPTDPELGIPSSPPLSQQLSRYGRTLPPLMASAKIAKKAAIHGFEWENVHGVWDKFQEELSELTTALSQSNKAHQQEELGDVLFCLVNLARWYDLDPVIALHDTNHKFLQRISRMESIAHRPLSEYTPDQLDELWHQAKHQLRQSPVPPPTPPTSHGSIPSH